MSSRANPFPGLRSFEPEEDYLYFGREENIDDVLRRLRTNRFLAILGTSGSGKSSLVRAGLVPALHSGYMTAAGSSWRIALFRPGDDPIGNLARALANPEVLGGEEDPDGFQEAFIDATLHRSAFGLADALRQSRIPPQDNLLVVADQFEELFRFRRNRQIKRSADEAAAFVKLLLQASRQQEVRIYVVLTMRSHFIGDCMPFAGLPEAINDGQYLVPRMTREQLGSAITGPVAVGGAAITPRLVNRLMNEVGDNPDQLPVLQHALMRIWDHWEREHSDGEPIDLQDYQAIGTMKDALSLHAEEAFQELASERAGAIAERMFKALSEQDSDNRLIRRPAALGELCGIARASREEVIEAAESFRRPGRSFLMPPAGIELEDDSVLDISHESLIRLWNRLRGWVGQEAHSAATYLRLSEAAALHAQDRAGLWRDPELQLGLNWLEESRPTAEWAQRYNPDFSESIRFLEQSRNEREQEIARRERERKRKLRQARLLAAVLGSAAVITLLAALGMAYLKQQADQSALVARARLLVSHSAREAEDKFDTPILLALQAYRMNPDEESRSNLVRALQRPSEQLWLTLHGHRDAVSRVSWSPDGQLLASTGYDRTVRLWEPSTGRLLHTLEGHQDVVSQLAWSPRGRLLASAGLGKDIRLWDAAAGQLLHVLSGHEAQVNGLAWSPDRELLASAGADRTVRIWKADSGQQERVLTGHTAEVSCLDWDPAGLASGSVDGTVRLWDAESEGTRRTLPHSDEAITGLAWMEGALLATATDGGAVRVWNTQSGQVEQTHQSHPPGFTSVSWGAQAGSGSGAVLASGGTGGRVRFHDGSPALGDSLEGGPDDRITAIGWHPEGQMLASAGSDFRVKVWSRTGFVSTFEGHEDEVRSVAWNPDGTLLASAGFDRTIKLWRLEPQGAVRTFPGHQFNAEAVAWSPDGAMLASGGRDGTAKLWDAASGGLLEALPLPGSESVTCVAWNADGTLLATAGPTGSVRLWGLQPPAIQRTLRAHDDEVAGLAFSPDGRMLASAGFDQAAKLWNPEAGELLQTLSGHEDEVTAVAWSPDGTMVATGSVDQAVRLWAAGTGEPIRTMTGHQGMVTGVAWSPQGDLLASGGADLSLRLWEPASGRLVRTLAGHEDEITSLSWSPDGERLASAGRDRAVKVWVVRSGELLVTLRGHGDVINQVSWSPDGLRLATAGLDGKVKLWELDEQRWIEHARRVVHRNLTEAEWRAVMGAGVPYEKTFPEL